MGDESRPGFVAVRYIGYHVHYALVLDARPDVAFGAPVDLGGQKLKIKCCPFRKKSNENQRHNFYQSRA